MVDIIEKQQFSVIGKMGEGLAIESSIWIPPLWQEANKNFNEISSLAKLDVEGKIVGIWGAMSDVNENFECWNKAGKYLAGCEVTDEAVAPDGWTKWIIPAFKYVATKCTQDSYQAVLNQMITDYLPRYNYQIVGAIQEFYHPGENSGALYLYFPIEKM